jgi:hypothetical protein
MVGVVVGVDPDVRVVTAITIVAIQRLTLVIADCTSQIGYRMIMV